MGLPKFLHKYTDGDLKPDIVGALPYDLAGHTVELHVRRPDETLLVKTATLDAYDEDAGTTTFRFVLEAGDLQVGLNQVCQVKDLDALDAAASWPLFLLDVIEGP